MQLMYPDEMPEVIQGRLCRESRLFTIIFWVILLALMVGIPGFIWWKADWPWWATMLGVVCAGVLLRLAISSILRVFFRTNWVLQLTPFGLWLNTRYYLNCFFERARTAIYLPYEDIASVHEQVVQRSEEDDSKTTTWKEHTLDIRLKEPVSEEVRAEIAEERRRKQSNKYFFGLITSRSRHGHVPVLMPQDDLLRVLWRGKGTCVVPSLATVLAELKPHVAVGEAAERDLSKVKDLTGEELDRLIVELVQNGDQMAAMKMLAERRGYTLTRAHDFIEQLNERLN